VDAITQSQEEAWQEEEPWQEDIQDVVSDAQPEIGPRTYPVDTF
jgi:hypothetical protein